MTYDYVVQCAALVEVAWQLLRLHREHSCWIDSDFCHGVGAGIAHCLAGRRDGS